MDKKSGLDSHAATTDVTYWAAKPSSEIADSILDKIRQYYLFLYQSGRLDLYEKVYSMYYGPALQGAQVAFTGQQGELVSITVNRFRNLIKRLITLVTSERPAFECRSTNTDHKSQAQVILGQGLLDYYLREKKLENVQINATELAMLYGEAFISVEWNASLGEPYATDPESGEVKTQGDIEYRYYSPLDMARDPVQTDPHHSIWKCPIIWTNKYELAEKFPEYYERIVNLTPEYDFFGDFSSNLLWQSRQALFGDFVSDEIPMFIFYHGKSKTLPKGRMTWILADGTTLVDGPIPYTEVPVYRISAGEWLGTPFGYTMAFDLMPVQEMSDSLHSTVCTNLNALGVANVYAQKGNDVEVSTIAGGMNFFQGNSETPPQVMQLSGTSPETFKYMEILDASQDGISGVNAVAQGNPQREMSGQMAALMQSMAIQFSMDLQGSYFQMFEDTGTATLDRLKTYATVPRVAAIAGKSNRKYMEEFVGADIEGINRVLVTKGNPMMNTVGGKLTVADNLLSKGLITTPEQYIMVLTTGKLEPMYENLQSTLMLIRRENEMIQEGQIPPVLMTDNPLLHISEHATVANSPEARSNPQVMQAYVTHLQMHLANWKGGIDPQTGQFVAPMDLDLANLLKIPAPPVPMMGMPGAMPQNMDPSGQPKAGSGEPVPSSQPEQSGAGIKMPKTPQMPPGTPMANQEMAVQ